MKSLNFIMIIAGSALMVYNIIRYGIFIKTNRRLERGSSGSGLQIISLLLLIFFLIGYLVVGFGGMADIMMSSILLGGSIFVFIILSVMYSIIGHIRDTEQMLATQYEEIKNEIYAMTNDSMAFFHVNLTTDEIEERGGEYLYDSDYDTDKYSELMNARGANIIDYDYYETNNSLFTREGLLEHFNEGLTNASEILLVRRKDGVASFVRFEATLTKKPVSGDIVAFIVERPFNTEVVRKNLLEKVMMDQYDKIAYIVEGDYKVITSNVGKKEGLLITCDDDDTYESLYLNEILPSMVTEDFNPAPNPLRLSVIEKELADKDHYVVDARFIIEGKSRYKHFDFYKINEKAHFYLMLLSDSTKIAEHEARKAAARTLIKEEAEAARAAEENKAREEKQTPAQSPASADGAEKNGALGALKLLVADDNEINREIAALILSGEGYEITLAENGSEAVEKIKSNPGGFDAVLMDVNMPVMNGYEATAAIRALPDAALSGIPIIAMTAGAFEEDRNAALAAGMNGFTTKPIEPEKINAALKKALSR